MICVLFGWAKNLMQYTNHPSPAHLKRHMQDSLDLERNRSRRTIRVLDLLVVQNSKLPYQTSKL